MKEETRVAGIRLIEPINSEGMAVILNKVHPVVMHNTAIFQGLIRIIKFHVVALKR